MSVFAGRAAPLLVLLLAGAAWGATQPLAKLAVREGYRHFGILFWQMVLGSAALGAVLILRGRALPMGRAHVRFYLVIALVGSVLPGVSSYTAAIHLPSGVLSILLSSVPILAFPVALALGLERFAWRRLAGLSMGFAGVALLLLPGASLPDPSLAIWVLVALLSSAFYALEGNIVALWGTRGLDPVQVLCGASLLGIALTLPAALLSGQFIDPRGPWGAPDLAILASSTLHVAAYCAYVWLVGRAGPVFAVQIAYFVTLFGVTWAMIFLGERYSELFWAAMLLMLGGLALVQPRRKSPLVPALRPDKDALT